MINPYLIVDKIRELLANTFILSCDRLCVPLIQYAVQEKIKMWFLNGVASARKRKAWQNIMPIESKILKIIPVVAGKECEERAFTLLKNDKNNQIIKKENLEQWMKQEVKSKPKNRRESRKGELWIRLDLRGLEDALIEKQVEDASETNEEPVKERSPMRERRRSRESERISVLKVNMYESDDIIASSKNPNDRIIVTCDDIMFQFDITMKRKYFEY